MQGPMNSPNSDDLISMVSAPPLDNRHRVECKRACKALAKSLEELEGILSPPTETLDSPTDAPVSDSTNPLKESKAILSKLSAKLDQMVTDFNRASEHSCSFRFFFHATAARR
jgi:hypothetical protein